MISKGKCHRKGCGKPGCNIHFIDVGFVCSECQEEFKNLYVKICAKRNEVANIYTCFDEFMKLDKNPKILDTSKLPGTVDNFFKIHEINTDER